MDPQHGNQYNNPGNGHNQHPNFPYSGGAQNDPFHSFINTEDETAFDNTWPTDFTSHHQPSNGFDHTAPSWQQNSYPSTESSFLPISQYNAEPRFPSGDSNYHFSSFNSNPAQEFSSREELNQTTYQGAQGYNSAPLNNGPPFQYSGPQELEQASQTISPAAIESYSNYSQPPLAQNRNIPQPDSTQHFGTSLGNLPYGGVRVGGASAALSIQDWRQLATRTVKSIDKPGLRIKPTNQFENVTRSKRFDGFIFVGNSSVAVNSGKATVPRYKRKKSRNEAMQLLEKEKGGDPWHPDREPLVKKLKIAAKKQAGPYSTVASAQNRGSSSSSSDSDSDDSSELYSESEPEKDIEEPSPLPSVRPVDPNKAVEYDLIKTVWARRSSVLSGTVIRVSLGETWDIFKGIRDKWKAKCTSLQQAVEKKDQASEKAFERRVAEQRRLLESCISLTLKHGHPSIVEKLGENPVLLVVFYQFLADRIKDGEYNGSFIGSILQLMARCTNIDTSLLEKTKLDKLLQRLHKRGDEEGKKLALKILDNAKSADGKPSIASHGPSLASKSGQDSIKSMSSDVKKDRQGEVKRPVNEANSKGVNGTVTSKAKASPGDARSTSKSGSDSTDSKAKVINVPSKPSAFFSSLKSASKKPGTSTRSDDINSNIASDKKSTTPAAAAKPAFSFAATMAGLAKQKEEIPSKAEETRKPETAEEKRKRLRKEQRRKLRVSFKNEDELVSIRTFMHDPEEEIGHEDSQVRDVGDSKGEGQMLKMHKDLELDDDEEYEPPDDISPPWIAPQATDFSIIEETERVRNFSNRGGTVNIESSERNFQHERENGTLMAIYSSTSDIPTSPREPADPYTGDFIPERNFGLPESFVKSREAEYRARMDAQSPANLPQTPDISAILQMFNNTKQPQSQQPQPVPDSSNPLAAIFAKLSNNPSAPLPQAASQQPAAPAYNLQNALASIQQQQPQQGYQTQSTYGTPQTNPVPNLQAILSQFGNQGAAPQAPPMQSFPYNPNANSFGMNEDRKRQLENDEGDYGRKKARGKPFNGVPRLPCKFWQEGKCRKGDECTFLHEST